MDFLRKGSTPHTRSSWLYGKARWLVGTILFLLGTAATIMGVPALGNQIRTDVPGVRCWFPVPMDDSKFTIVMAPFVTVDANGAVQTKSDGRQLARLLYARLESSFEGLNLDLPYELRSPDQSCPIQGATREERAAAAEELAERIHSDVVIYGAIQQTEEGAELQPEFYVNYRGFTEAGDLVGPHELGRPLRVNLPVQAETLEGIADHPINARAQALSLIALGLANFAVDNYEQALDYFIAADEVPNWPESAGKETLYVLMGNTASRLAATTLDSGFVDEALDYFDKALDIDPDFARALAGQGSALYQLALGNLEKRQGSQVDLDLLDEAERTFLRAAELASPAGAEIGLKTDFGLGQIYLVRYYRKTEGEDWLAKARAKFQAMVDSNAASAARNRDLVGHAYARLGLIANQIDQQPDAAIPLYQQAIALVSPRWQAQYQLDLGDIYLALNDVEKARSAYEEAQSLAELYSDETRMERAGDRLDALP